MKIERLQQISFAEGQVEDFIEQSVEAASPELTEQAAKLHTAWSIIVAGLKELRQENHDLLSREEQVKILLNQ